MSNDERFVKIDYLTLEVGDPVYISYDGSYEFLGTVSEFIAGHVYIGCGAYDIPYIQECYTINKNFYNPHNPEDSTKKTEFPKKVLTNEEIYEMLTSDVALLGLSKKAVRKIEKAVLAKLRQGECE